MLDFCFHLITEHSEALRGTAFLLREEEVVKAIVSVRSLALLWHQAVSRLARHFFNVILDTGSRIECQIRNV